MDSARQGSWSSSVEPYLNFDIKCGLSKVLQTRRGGFSLASQRDRFRKRDSSQSDSSHVCPVAFKREDRVHAALRFLHCY